MKQLLFLSIVISFFTGCKKDLKTVNQKKINRIDTIISNTDKIALNYSYCDIVNSKKFKSINLDYFDIPNIDSLSYGFKINKDTLLFTYQFSKNTDNKSDRSIIYNRKITDLTRITIRDSTKFSFSEFMCDYRNARFYIDKNILLVKSQPSDWSGLINQYEFYQLIDLNKKICYEFFLNEDKGCVNVK